MAGKESSPIQAFASAGTKYYDRLSKKPPVQQSPDRQLTSREIRGEQKMIAPLLDAYTDWHTAADNPTLREGMHFISSAGSPALIKEYFERFADPVPVTIYEKDSGDLEKEKIPFVKIEFGTQRKIYIGEGDKKRKIKPNVTERRMLQLLIENQDSMLSKEELMNEVFKNKERKTDEEINKMTELLIARTIINGTPLISVDEEDGIKSYGITEFGVDVVWGGNQLNNRILELRNSYRLSTRAIASRIKMSPDAVQSRLWRLKKTTKVEESPSPYMPTSVKERILELYFNDSTKPSEIKRILLEDGILVTKKAIEGHVWREKRKRKEKNPLQKAS